MNILVHQYENFSMKGDETVQQIYERLTLLVNALELLEKSFTNGELVRTFPRSWEVKKTAIEEARDLTTLPLEQLMSSLMSYEIEKSSRPDIKPISVAFKATRETAEASDDDTEAEAETDDELAMIAKRLLKFASKRHIKTDCPLLREKEQPSVPNKGKRAMLAWEESDESDDEQELALVCSTTRTELNHTTEGSLCLRTEAKENEWYLDSGCSKHVTGDPSKFSNLTLQNGGFVSFGENSKGL
ncbi:hypothetical protein MLD38_021327 [Melastoma candidum]|uniref:Uncharacterized protein n=1 Tax=Melastoma candidum TaxID=119954 RepID=A0ACB9QGZ0_9MYRT|nr:hypothetical protein MLD38_021327 [Melastoma candidum]